MQYTDNLQLRKPGQADSGQIDDINANMDEIDGHLWDIKQALDGVVAQLTELVS